MVALLWALLWLVIGTVLIVIFGLFMFASTAVIESIKERPIILLAHLGVLALAALFFRGGESLMGVGIVAVWIGGSLYFNRGMIATTYDQKRGGR